MSILVRLRRISLQWGQQNNWEYELINVKAQKAKQKMSAPTALLPATNQIDRAASTFHNFRHFRHFKMLIPFVVIQGAHKRERH